MAARIAVLLDENTSSGATRYEAHKGYFQGLRDAGAAPFGLPYFAEMVPGVVADFDGLLSVGGRFAYPAAWYLDGEASFAPESPRLAVEQALMSGFLAAGKAAGLWPFVHFNRLHVVPPCTTSIDEVRQGLAIIDEALAVTDAYVTA